MTTFLLDRNFQRVYFRTLRKQINTRIRILSSNFIVYKIFYYNILKSSKNIAVFLSFDGEIDTYFLIKKLWKENYNVYVPIVCPENDKNLKFIKYNPYSTLKLNRFNIFEPIFNINHCISIYDLDLIFVPLVAFDKLGYRLGMGGGFYDRMLKDYKVFQNFFPVGLAFDCQYTDQKIDSRSWDVALPAILTPSKFWIFKNYQEN